MKKVLSSILTSVAILFAAAVTAEDAIDTSAVTQLVELRKASPLMPALLLEEQLLANDAGGLTLLQRRFQTTEKLQQFYTSLDEKDWIAIQRCAAQLKALEPEFDSIREKLTELTNVPLGNVNVFGVVGAGNTAATASPSSVVLGLEMICASGENPLNTALTLENYMAHELVHVVQYRLTKRTNFRFNLLEISLLEGSADYVADMLLGDEYMLDDVRSEHGERQGRTLLQSFEPAMLQYDYAPWLYTPMEAMPMDMGYWIGFQLAVAYIKNGGALIELLTLDDATVIYERANL